MSFRHAHRSIALAVTALALTASAASAQPLTVTSTADTPDASPANGICEAPCTLRGAIQTANGAGSAGADTIALPAGKYDLAISGADGADPAATGDLDITQDLTITGADQGTTTVDGKGLDRVFDVAGATATISGVTITGGLATDGAFTTAGGGIRVGRHPVPGTDVPGTLTLIDATLTANGAQDGAGIATDSVAAHLTLTRVTITSNVAAPGSTEGGGVNERFGGSVVITDSLIRGNSAFVGAGIVDDGGGTISVTGSAIDGNHAAQTGEGGGVFETGGGTVTLTRTVVSANTAGEGAGVVEDGGGTVTIADSWIRDNVVNGASFPNGGGVLKDASGTVNITGSTIAGNSAGTGAGIQIFSSGTFTMTNSTLTANHATTRGGGIQATGAGTMTLTNVTLHDDIADAGASEIDNCVSSPGCGATAHTIKLRNTIVASAHANCTGPVASAGHNLDSGGTCGFAGAGDLASRAPLLDALATNGGPTPTQAEIAGSPTIDAGDPAGCPATDQRGLARPGGAACDIGAFELQAAAPPAPPPVAKPVPPKPKPAAKAVKATDIIAFPSTKACVSRRAFHIRLRKVKGVTVASASVSVNGKRVSVIKGKRLTAGVDLRGLPRGRFTVKIVLKTSTGKTLTGSRRYRTCTVKRRGHTKHKL